MKLIGNKEVFALFDQVVMEKPILIVNHCSGNEVYPVSGLSLGDLDLF